MMVWNMWNEHDFTVKHASSYQQAVKMSVIRSSDNKIWLVQARLEDSIRDITMTIAGLSWIPVEDQTLIFKGTELGDEMFIYECPFGADDCIGIDGERTPVFLRLFNGSHITTYFYPRETIFSFKKRVEERVGIPPNHNLFADLTIFV
jgi:hypothetical protein